MSNKRYKEQLKRAIENASARLLRNTGQPKEKYLYLTRKQYDIDPDGWHDVLRQRGLPDDAIVFIPDSFK